MEEIEILKKWNDIFRIAKTKKKKCFNHNCDKDAIKSHVLQKNGILRQISEKNHLYQFSEISAFEKVKKQRFQLSRIGINDVYTFPGFCAKHDSEIFKFIEGEEIDFSSHKTANLFSYRALCQEIRRKEIAVDISQEIIKTKYKPALVQYMMDYKGLLNGLTNLNFFKKEFEDDFKNESSKKFNYNVCKIPRVELCISAPLNIYDPDNPLSETHNEIGEVMNNPFVTSSLNIFPLEHQSIVITATHRDYRCSWTEELFSRFNITSGDSHLKLISDLITLRVEFWCISPRLKNEIGSQKFKEMIDIWTQEVLNFDNNIPLDFNIFAKN